MGSATIPAEQDFSTAFLSLYEEMKRRFRERGMHATIQTLERCQVILQAFLETGRPLKPSDLVDMVAEDRAFSCKSKKAMVMYTLKKMAEAGVVVKKDFRGRKCYYHLEVPVEGLNTIQESGRKAELMEVLRGCRRLQELWCIMRMWRLPSLVHAMDHEIIFLKEKVENLMGHGFEDRERLGVLLDRLEDLGQSIGGEGHYSANPFMLLKDIVEMARQLYQVDQEAGTFAELKYQKPAEGRRKK